MRKWAFLDTDAVIQAIAEGDIHTNTFTSEVDVTLYNEMVEVLDYRGEAVIGKKWNGITDKFE
jgi:hypothetical protein